MVELHNARQSTDFETPNDDIRERYLRERDKRLAVSRGYITPASGTVQHYLDDPYTPPIARNPLADRVDALVVGGGFGGLLTAVRLKEAGLRRVRIIDSAGDVGGVWYWNRYPGAQCDADSYCYLPLLEETGYMPVEKYSHSPEIRAHAQRIARHFALYELALFQTRVRQMVWNETTFTWTVRTDRGDAITTSYVVLATGAFSNPILPDIEGLESFEGHSFHTSRWDYSYTGGDATSRLSKLHDKVVAVVGTGATAVQVVPPLGASAKKLLVFQRTPAAVDVRNNRPTDPDWVASLESGWQRRRIHNLARIVSGYPVDRDLVDDGWTHLYKALLNPEFAAMADSEAAKRRDEADLRQMARIWTRIDNTITDSATAAALKPYYHYLCKSPCFHDEYLDAFNRSNVELINTDGRGIERIYDAGVVANGQKFPVDCIVFATGFEGIGNYPEKTGIDIIGRRGVSMKQRWSDGMLSLHGVLSSGFPNLFFNLASVDGQATLSVNMSYTLGGVADHIAKIVCETRRRGARACEIEPETEAQWVKLIESGTARSRTTKLRCTPGRRNNNGNVDQQPPRAGIYPGPAVEFFEQLAAWRDVEQYAGLNFLMPPSYSDTLNPAI
ncbi:Pentalenolactone D synthase [Mycobacterium basiliense]|uniref:Pentalenolactone D synthase n=1 Tax=Mycobacterium basiliense TaxID=2094119 RepID=A0A3S4BC04_9MYCO|nr:NAD(P)/FAD-dependent oxidoreductase [Mycobacterium basiliense]VDM86573.1 Pentalenolactone D synthase [Mycobacterium basiliense]